MAAPEGPGDFTPEGIQKMMDDRLAEVTTGLFITLSDPALRERAVNHPDIGEDAVKAYEALGAAFNDAQVRVKADPTSNPAWADYHRSCADIMMIGGPLLDKLKAAGIKPTMQ